MPDEGDRIDHSDEPTGDGQRLTRSVTPLVSVPTTPGTGEEIARVAIVDVEPKGITGAIARVHVRTDAAVLESDPLNDAGAGGHRGDGEDERSRPSVETRQWLLRRNPHRVTEADVRDVSRETLQDRPRRRGGF